MEHTPSFERFLDGPDLFDESDYPGREKIDATLEKVVDHWIGDEIEKAAAAMRRVEKSMTRERE